MFNFSRMYEVYEYQSIEKYKIFKLYLKDILMLLNGIEKC